MKNLFLLLVLSVTLVGCTTFEASDIQTPEGQAAFVIARKEAFKQFRGILSKQIKNEFDQDPSMRYEVYEARLSAVQTIGRTHRDKENVKDVVAQETRNVVLKRRLNAEDPIELVRWGPLYVDDEGSIKFDLSTFYGYFRGGSKAPISPDWATEDRHTNQEKWGDSWDTSARARVNINPFRAVAAQDLNEMISNYGFMITTTYSTNVLHRKIFDIEYEAKIDNTGEPSFFFNFVLPMR